MVFVASAGSALLAEAEVTNNFAPIPPIMAFFIKSRRCMLIKETVLKWISLKFI